MTFREPGSPEILLETLSASDDNVVQTFQLEKSGLRGRVVRMGSVLDEILSPHAYPYLPSVLLAESMTLSLALSSMLKYEGTFALQINGDGPVSMVIADVTSDAELRGYVGFDADRLASVFPDGSGLALKGDTLKALTGAGRMAFTVDQGRSVHSYQGIVELDGASMAEIVQNYFLRSEQIETGVRIATGRRDEQWRSGAIMLQRMPGKSGEEQDEDEAREDWQRAMILLQSCTDTELLDPELHSNVLLNRLFHEEGVRVYPATPVRKGCRCSDVKLRGILDMMSEEERLDMQEDGKITMNCRFCNRDFVFDGPSAQDDR